MNKFFLKIRLFFCWKSFRCPRSAWRFTMLALQWSKNIVSRPTILFEEFYIRFFSSIERRIMNGYLLIFRLIQHYKWLYIHSFSHHVHYYIYSVVLIWKSVSKHWTVTTAWCNPKWICNISDRRKVTLKHIFLKYVSIIWFVVNFRRRFPVGGFYDYVCEDSVK
jgi:hypothetical protein